MQSSSDSSSPRKFVRSVESPGRYKYILCIFVIESFAGVLHRSIRSSNVFHSFSGSLADSSSNGNSTGQVSSSSSGSADGGDDDRKRKKSVGDLPSTSPAAAEESTAASKDVAGVRGFFEIQGDKKNGNEHEEEEDNEEEEEEEIWPDYLHESVPSYPERCPASLAASASGQTPEPQPDVRYDHHQTHPLEQQQQQEQQTTALSFSFPTASSPPSPKPVDDPLVPAADINNRASDRTQSQCGNRPTDEW
ncbi:hypothetical protein BX666DRAFT_1217834 [Dichotomocladium elegans]|nr:hypothetical protein BX666DRAFT_1217834 [Dichotomocladium elegans]